VTESILPLLETPRPNTFGHGDPAASVRRLASQLDKAGVPDTLAASRALLDRAEEVGQAARDGKEGAIARLTEARGRLLGAEVVDAGEYSRVLMETGPWLDSDIEGGRAAPAMHGLMEIAQQLQGRALQVAVAEASGLHSRLQGVARGVVERVAGVPALPQAVWSANPREADRTAIQLGHELSWSVLVREATKFEAIHAAGQMLRDSGGCGAVIYPDGCPERIGSVWLSWVAASEAWPQLRLLPGPLRLRAAVDRGLKPGLWLPADHLAQPPKRRGPLAVAAGWVSGS
jgi:hypothetical protein